MADGKVDSGALQERLSRLSIDQLPGESRDSKRVSWGQDVPRDEMIRRLSTEEDGRRMSDASLTDEGHPRGHRRSLSSSSSSFNPFDMLQNGLPGPRSRSNSLSVRSRSSSMASGRRDSNAGVQDGEALVENYERLEKRKSQDLSQIPIPLAHEWVFWFDERSAKKGVKSKDFEANVMTQIGRFNTVQDFWRYWNCMVDVYDLPKYCNLRMFRSDVKPMWEDPANIHGGRYVIPCPDKDTLKLLWGEVVLAIIGHQFGVGDDVTGIVLSVRPKGEDLVCIWNSDKNKHEAIMTMINVLREQLKIHLNDADIKYQINEDAVQYNKNFKPIAKKGKGVSRDPSPERKDRSRGNSPQRSRGNSPTRRSRGESPTRRPAGGPPGLPSKPGWAKAATEKKEDAAPAATSPAASATSAGASPMTSPTQPSQNVWAARAAAQGDQTKAAPAATPATAPATKKPPPATKAAPAPAAGGKSGPSAKAVPGNPTVKSYAAAARK